MLDHGTTEVKGHAFLGLIDIETTYHQLVQKKDDTVQTRGSK